MPRQIFQSVPVVNFSIRLIWKLKTKARQQQLISPPISYSSNMSDANFPHTSKKTATRLSFTEILRYSEEAEIYKEREL